MNILLIGGKSTDDQDSYSLRNFGNLLRETAAITSDNVKSVFLDQLIFEMSNDGFNLYETSEPSRSLEIDQVILRGPKMRLSSEYAYYVGRFCAYNNMACINDYSLYYPGTKFAQNIVFAEKQARVLKTLYSVDKKSLIKAAEANLGYPYILKTNVGSHGDSNYLINSYEEAAGHLTEEPETDFLAQEYCANDRDYRLLIVAGNKLIFERKGTTGSHINNTSKGGEARLADDALPADVIAKAREIAEHLGLTLAGVDVMPRLDTDEFYFLEINSQPQMYTGAFLDEKKQLLVDLLRSLKHSA